MRLKIHRGTNQIGGNIREDCFCLDSSDPAIVVFIPWEDKEDEA